ncbi:stage II sporulation protein M [Roseivirga sp. UBA1976]|uniref:stage II sporulation protein M n=1 Tax=Roseivirga sp. UBA1976 TaxID=1947386 RepID=UPI00257D5A59|nr:stage II sporulation protein M [Roseivirga sp. UBA1976]MEC7754513.1 stage II sporulation protein M [Bacteroidota bacterium]|tara:strand:- start:3511 stop:4479 length:969 start_codon:yes stop_codon:yes gene_type:complete
MRESVFVKANISKWEKFESLISSKEKKDPDELASLFIQLTDDLAFARTHYPKSDVTSYLNNLSTKVHQDIYRNKKERKNRFVRFWKYELPEIFWAHRKEFMASFLFFLVSCIIGAFSAAQDQSFVRLILGDTYVNLTLENIEKGEPMGIYGSMAQTDMFFAITFNNIRVSFVAFAFGIASSVGTVYLLFRNGVMLGSFQYFFYSKGLLLTSVLTIWIHGTIEIISIIMAGGAGLIMGNSWMFPGTLPRLHSLRQGALKGAKVVLGLVPLFIIAGFLESFVTRLFGMPNVLKATIIVLSLISMVYYIILYPRKLYKNGVFTSN